MKESRCQVARAFDFVMDLKDGWPEALRGIKTSQLAREILNEKERYITDLKESGKSHLSANSSLLTCQLLFAFGRGDFT